MEKNQSENTILNFQSVQDVASRENGKERLMIYILFFNSPNEVFENYVKMHECYLQKNVWLSTCI